MSPPPPCTKRLVDLPLSQLHVMETGTGPLLIMLPATISEVDDYVSLVRFMGQWFHVVFFELPGHGLSTPFPEKFSSFQVAELVEQLADSLGCERFNLMGFSFGGILAMRAFFRVFQRIDRLILNAPCLGHRTVTLAPWRKKMIRRINHFLDRPTLHRLFCRLAHNRATLPVLVKFLGTVGRLERTLPLKEKLSKLRPTTLAVLNAQIEEILTTEFEVRTPKFDTKCYF